MSKSKSPKLLSIKWVQASSRPRSDSWLQLDRHLISVGDIDQCELVRLEICEWLTQSNLEGEDDAVGVQHDKTSNRLKG